MHKIKKYDVEELSPYKRFINIFCSIANKLNTGSVYNTNEVYILHDMNENNDIKLQHSKLHLIFVVFHNLFESCPKGPGDNKDFHDGRI